MAYTDIDKPSDYFNTVLYTGNSASSRAISVGFQSDLVWNKPRTNTNDHQWVDSVRGGGKVISSNLSDAEYTAGNTILSFGSDGFTCGDGASVNANGVTYASWNWKAGTSFTNDASSTGIGSIDSTGSASDTSGFSIVSYTGTGSAGTIKHGLSTAPKMIIVKNRSVAGSWRVYHKDVGATKFLDLNTTAASSVASTIWNDTEPTSSVFSIGTHESVSGNGHNLIAYCFAEKQGYSKIGGFVANGSTDNSFIYTGMKTAFVMFKRSDGTGNWGMWDNKRNTFNIMDKYLLANTSGAEGTSAQSDLLSNGIKIRTSGFASGNWIYMAFAENPFVTSTGVPATAR